MNQEQHHNRAYWIKWGIALLIPVVTYFSGQVRLTFPPRHSAS